MNTAQQQRAAALAELVRSRLPAEFDVDGDATAWPFIGHGLLSRATGTLDSIFLLQPTERGADAMTLLRSMYEHVVHFAWLAGDPSELRIGSWKKNDLSQRITAHHDALKVGVELFNEHQLAQFTADREALPGPKKLKLQDLAEEADGHWESRVEAIRPRDEARSFRGLYATAYRLQSGVAHPGLRSLHPVVRDISPTRKRVQLEDALEGHGPYGMATVVFGLGLLVSEQALGWPSEAQLDDIFDRYRNGSVTPRRPQTARSFCRALRQRFRR